jgi:hypothetical protein
MSHGLTIARLVFDAYSLAFRSETFCEIIKLGSIRELYHKKDRSPKSQIVMIISIFSEV